MLLLVFFDVNTIMESIFEMIFI